MGRLRGPRFADRRRDARCTSPSTAPARNPRPRSSAVMQNDDADLYAFNFFSLRPASRSCYRPFSSTFSPSCLSCYHLFFCVR